MSKLRCPSFSRFISTRALIAFFLPFCASLLLFLPFVIQDKGMFSFYSDYNSQQIPFNILINDAIHTRAGEWNWNTDLGSSTIGSYSFYLLGSPFFWCLTLFPSSFIPYVLPIVLCVKMGLMGLGAFLYFCIYTKADYALLGSFLYVFSGFSIYNLPYNHFHDAFLIFPFLLWSLEMKMRKKRNGYFSLFVCLSAMINYYFFFGQAIFLVVYWLINIFSKNWHLSKRMLFSVVFEALTGVLMASVLLIPSFLSIIQNNRVTNVLSESNLLIFQDVQMYLNILHSFVFPPDLLGRPAFFSEIENLWSAPTLWFPCFCPVCIIAYFFNHNYKDWIIRAIIVFSLFSMVPVFNQSFSLFNSFYYSRWFYMFTLVLILASVKLLEENEKVAIKWKWPFIISFLLVILFSLLAIFFAEKNINSSSSVTADPMVILTSIVFSFVCILCCLKLIIEQKNQEKHFVKWAILFVVVIGVGFGWYTIGAERKIARIDPDANLSMYLSCSNDSRKIQAAYESRFFRMESDDAPNLGMFWKIPSLTCFHSTVSGSIIDFYNSLGVERTMISNPEHSKYAIRALTSTEWCVSRKKYGTDCTIKGFSLNYQTDNFCFFKNDNTINMGFSYDSYILRSEYDSLPVENRDFQLLKTLVVEDANEADVSSILSHFDLDSAQYTYDEFANDCLKRNSLTVDNFSIVPNGFGAEVCTKKPTIFFFSVPYEKGWSAYVNGKPTEIIKSNVGFMSIVAEPGDNQIKFVYKTPGLRLGLLISLVSVVLLILWLLIESKLFKMKKSIQNT